MGTAPESPAAAEDLAGALKTESWRVWLPLEHFGQAMACFCESTICS
jgi:hypothetical protein